MFDQSGNMTHIDKMGLKTFNINFILIATKIHVIFSAYQIQM